MGSQLILFPLMLKQGFDWFTLAQGEQEIENILLSHWSYVKQKDLCDEHT